MKQRKKDLNTFLAAILDDPMLQEPHQQRPIHEFLARDLRNRPMARRPVDKSKSLPTANGGDNNPQNKKLPPHLRTPPRSRGKRLDQRQASANNTSSSTSSSTTSDKASASVKQETKIGAPSGKSEDSSAASKSSSKKGNECVVLEFTHDSFLFPLSERVCATVTYSSFALLWLSVFRFSVSRREVKVTFELCIQLMEEIFRVKEKHWAKRTTFGAAINMVKTAVIFNSKVCEYMHVVVC